MCFCNVCLAVFYLFVSAVVFRMSAVTMALTQTQWKTAAVSVWVTAKAVKWSTSHSMKKKAWVSPGLRGPELTDLKI